MSEEMKLAMKARWCGAQVEPGQEDWPKGATWHPLPGVCKRRGAQKVDGEWRCGKHSRSSAQASQHAEVSHG